MIWFTITLALLVVATFLNTITLYLAVRQPTNLVDTGQDVLPTPIPELSDFDRRILEFQRELNTPSYPDNVAQTYHPAVQNLPHDTVTDTPLRVAEEYAE